MIKKYNVSRPKKYFKDNLENTMWQNCGTMTEFHKQDGSVSRILEIPAIGLNANIFPFEDRAEKTYPRPQATVKSPEQEYNEVGSQTEETEIVNPEDIPY